MGSDPSQTRGNGPGGTPTRLYELYAKGAALRAQFQAAEKTKNLTSPHIGGKKKCHPTHEQGAEDGPGAVKSRVLTQPAKKEENHWSGHHIAVHALGITTRHGDKDYCHAEGSSLWVAAECENAGKDAEQDGTKLDHIVSDGLRIITKQ